MINSSFPESIIFRKVYLIFILLYSGKFIYYSLRSLLTSHVLANKRVKLYNVFGEEGDDIKYNFDQVLPGDSLELSIKKEIGGVKVVDLDLKKKSKTSSGTQHKKKDDIINEKNDQIKEKNRQIRTLRGRITQLEQDKNALKDDNKYLTQQNKYLTDCLLKSLPNNQQQPIMDNNYYSGGGNSGSSFSNNQQRPNMNNNNNYYYYNGGGGGFSQVWIFSNIMRALMNSVAFASFLIYLKLSLPSNHLILEEKRIFKPHIL
ncbi:unnamed protein product [Meloidogyne enterolobii]|uniref:Uncharacterized protein n=1 Tax=Meloidogyne enterolobii TaxID=390850 RepID=A0ACB1ATP6_MELEN